MHSWLTAWTILGSPSTGCVSVGTPGLEGGATRARGKEPRGVTATSGIANSPRPPSCPLVSAHLVAFLVTEAAAQIQMVMFPRTPVMCFRQ